MSLLLPGLDDYILSVLPPRPPVLVAMEEEAARRGIPIVGPAVARLLAQTVRLLGARRVFELGSSIGYSTLFLAEAVGEGGQVFYTDASEESAAEAQEWARRARLAERITFVVGDALTALDAQGGSFDLVFNDVDKEGYPEVFKRAVPRLRPGGILASDNVLWGGRLRFPELEDDAETAAIREFTRLCYASPDLETTLVPLRDGVLLTRKIR